ncbi:PKD domain-containing protein [Maribellus sp. CM-23]|uniref:PKD domain-containing protein n=1 Tax=Maribellus sp. CM-23 TaxID=2781026 RepID=UPI001F2AD859|nr:PKD domain-containing protein [Maribellus sp. CM-23]MCE4566625.1 PKD domain-containing protein [Maribellus sp. CM-23]
MKHFKVYNWRLLAATLLLSFFVACTEDPLDPTGDFTFSVNSDNTLAVTFAASGADAIAVTWDFGDGETSTSLRPVHTYEAGGTYPVVLTVLGESGSSPAVITKSVTVVDSPVAQFTYVAKYLTVSFTNSTTYGVSYSWDFGDGETSTEENPVHVYAETGEYTVSLTATGLEGSIPGTFTKTISAAEGIIAVENADFQLPGTVKIPTWGPIPGWDSDEQANDSGIDGPDGNGNFWGYLWNKEASVFNLTDHVIVSGETFRVTLDVWDAWSGGDNFVVTLYYNSGDGARNVLATKTFATLGNGLELMAPATEESVGARLGIELKANATGNAGWLNNGWTAFDNIHLFVR